jgi:hypothetical protein
MIKKCASIILNKKKNMMSIIKSQMDRNLNYLQALNSRSFRSFARVQKDVLLAAFVASCSLGLSLRWIFLLFALCP